MASDLELPMGVRKRKNADADQTVSIATRGPKGYAFRQYLDARFPGLSGVDQLEQLIAADVKSVAANAKLWKDTVAKTNTWIKEHQEEQQSSSGSSFFQSPRFLYLAL